MIETRNGERGIVMPCWCGVSRAWFALPPEGETCGGLRIINCECGGDQCVCHNHGEMECPGCEDCDEEDW
jgi:hypothetical protein